MPFLPYSLFPSSSNSSDLSTSLSLPFVPPSLCLVNRFLLLIACWPWPAPSGGTAAHSFQGSFRTSSVVHDEFHHRLLHSLFHRYDRRIQPPETPQMPHPVRINVTIVLGILIEMRENEQVAAYVISHTQRWQDLRLTWVPTDYGNVSELIVPAKAIWQPKIFVYNSMDTKDMLSDEKYDARLSHTGHVKVNIPQYVTCTCRLSIELFPFDTQFCAVALASPLLTVDEMAVYSNQPPNESYFAGNSEWNLINVSVRDMQYLEACFCITFYMNTGSQQVHYIFHLRRRPIFYIIVIVVPIFLISALSILGIFTPGSNDGPRSEKVSLGLGSLLAMTVLLGIVAGAMPKSNSIPLLGYYILSVILLCAVAVAISMAFMTASKRYVDNARVPSQLTYRLSLVRPRLQNAARMARAANKTPVERTKSIGEQLMGIRFTENYQEPEGQRLEEGEANCMLRKHVNYGSIRDSNSTNAAAEEGCPEKEQQQNGVGRNMVRSVGSGEKRTRLRVPGEEGSRMEKRRLTASGTDLPISDRIGLELSLIRSMVSYVADSQRVFNKKLEREKTREKIEREWARVFMKLDYVCLAIFQLLNLFSLLFFLKFAWADSPREPDSPLV